MTENPEQKLRFNATQLKTMAIAAMLIDHIAWAFVPLESPLGQVMHAIGRFTFPIMAFFVAEGFHRTRNFSKYFGRMVLFSIPSHFAFQYFNFGRIPLFSPHPGDGFMDFAYTSVLYTLSLGLFSLWIIKRWEAKSGLKIISVALLCILAYPGDFTYFATALVLVFGLGFGDRTQQLQSGALIIGFLVILSIQGTGLSSAYMLGSFLPLVFLRYYDGTQGKSKEPLVKYGFYLFYPLHLFLLGLLRYSILNTPIINF